MMDSRNKGFNFCLLGITLLTYNTSAETGLSVEFANSAQGVISFTFNRRLGLNTTQGTDFCFYQSC